MTTTKPTVPHLTIAVMNADVLQAIAAKGIAADSKLGLAQQAHGKTYAVCAAELRAGIASGLTSTEAFNEYRRRANDFAAKVAAARMRDYEGDDKAEATARHVAAINKGIDRDNKKAAYVAPKAEREEGEKAEAARKAEATRKATEREVAKLVKDLHKRTPDADEKDIKQQAKAIVQAQTKEARDEAKEQTRFAANEAKMLEQLAAFKARLPEVFQADVREVQLQIAAVIANLKHIQTKV
jgi:hypothetical protein